MAWTRGEIKVVQVLRNKNLATRFQILVEIAANQPNIQQKDIARRIGVTSQAVSEYVSKLEKDGWLSSDGRSHYRVTKEGVNWLLKALRELQSYSATAEKTLVNITTWAAIAGAGLSTGQQVSLVMKDGLLFAMKYSGKGARGIATCDAKQGEDIGVTNIEDIVMLESGKITVLEIPDIQNGGSRCADERTLKRWLNKADLIGAIGTEAIVTLKRLECETAYLYGVTQAAVEAARSGLSFVIVCSTSESPLLFQRFAEENTLYRVINARRK